METPFSYIPVVEAYGNFTVVDNEAKYYGETRSLMDAQRIYDYTVSRSIGDGALSMTEKLAVTEKQIKGHDDQNRALNTADDPLFVYNSTAGDPPPYKIGGSQVNPDLTLAAERAKGDIKDISMSHNPNQGAGLGGHSGKAYEILRDASSSSSFKYVKSIKSAVQRTYEILIDAIPRVYDTVDRQVSLTNEDGTTTAEKINMRFLREDGTTGIINDLSQGSYRFKVVAGDHYTSRRSQGISAIQEWATLDPSIIEEGKDIIYKMLSSPGTNDIAARIRKRMIEEGRVLESELTEEERQKIQQEIAAQANQPPNPLDQATVQAVLAQTQDLLSKIDERQAKIEIALQEQQRKDLETAAKISNDAQKLETDIQKTQSETLENLKDASIGEDGAIISPSVANAYGDIAREIP